MIRTLYALALIALIGSAAWAAGGIQQERRAASPGGVGFVLLLALQR